VSFIYESRGCSTPLEFDAEFIGEEIECPECKQRTALYKMEKQQVKTDAKEKIKDIGRDVGETVGAVAEVGAMAAGVTAHHLMGFVVSAIVSIGLIALGWSDGGGIGLLLAILVIVTYSGLSEVRKEIGSSSDNTDHSKQVNVGADPGFFFIGEILSTTGSALNWESCSPEKRKIHPPRNPYSYFVSLNKANTSSPDSLIFFSIRATDSP